MDARRPAIADAGITSADFAMLSSAASRRFERVARVDLAASLPKSVDILYDDCHFNENGARRVADLLIGALRASTR